MKSLAADILTAILVLIALIWGVVIIFAPIWLPAGLLIWWLT